MTITPSGIFWNYYRDEINDDENENDANENMLNNSKTMTSKSLKYKTKIIGTTPDNGNRLNAEVVVPLKYLSDIWKSLDLLLINCEKLYLSWSGYCVILEISRTFGVVPNTNPVRYQVTSQTNSATFQINNAKLYVPVVALSTNDNIRLNIKQGFKITISWNRYRSEITTQPKNNNLDYLIDLTFRNTNRLFLVSLKIVNIRDYFHK